MRYQAFEADGQPERPLGIPRLGAMTFNARALLAVSEMLTKNLTPLAPARGWCIQSDHERQT